MPSQVSIFEAWGYLRMGFRGSEAGLRAGYTDSAQCANNPIKPITIR